MKKGEKALFPPLAYVDSSASSVPTGELHFEVELLSWFSRNGGTVRKFCQLEGTGKQGILMKLQVNTP
jgi:hypothetical protein